MGRMKLLVSFMFQVLLFFVTFYETFAQESVVSYHVREEQGELTYIGNVARDSYLYGNVTSEQFSRMKFQILSQGNQFASLFVIDGSASTLKTNAVLDREELCPSIVECVLNFNVAVYLEDRNTGVLDLLRIIKIVVTIDDINDNSPQFPHKEITIPIAENSNVGAEFFTNGAIDHDTGGNNSVQRYVMEPPNEMFGLKVLQNNDGSSDLNIVVKYPLDRESRSFYQLFIHAIDGGSPVRTGSVKVNITIIDQNDNAPVFSKPEYDVTVPENVPENSTILVLTATDADAEDNGKVTYKFSPSTPTRVMEIFAINGTSGEITSKEVLDFETQTKWSFKIQAFDGGNPPRSTSVNVNINVADTNDNYPQININSPPGGPNISESAKPGSFVALVAVYDLDAGEIKCKVLGNDFRLEDFKIENNYKVVLNSELDHEVKDSYEVSIQCEDSGNPPKTNTTSFTVKVDDVNDNAPQFLKQQYVVTVQEEILQTMIEQVSARDKDSGKNGQVTYGLHPATMQNFTVNSRSGLITANTPFDREVSPIIQFDVMAWDAGTPPLTSTATVIINITDINDNPPLFPQSPLMIELNESDASQVVNLNVTDPDFGLNGQYTLEFPDNDYLDEYFSFDSQTGEIRTKKAIDREEIPYFKFWVKAVDKGIPQQSSSAEVILKIHDNNDNIPAIMYPNNSNNSKIIPVSAPVGLVIATVEAFDKDDGVNAQLMYFIEKGDTRDIFKMDVNTGQIRVGRDMEQKDADTYKLDIAVRDNGIPVQRTSWAKLNIIVEPANDTSIMAAQENKQNILIVAIFVAVTGALSIAIVATIFIIRYIDRRGRQQPPPKIPEGRFYESAKVDESLSGSSSVSKDSDAELLKRRAKKEVSFSLDDSSDIGNNSTLTNVTSFSTTKLMPSYMSMDYKPEDMTQNTTWLSNNTMSTDMNKTDIYSEKELSSLTTSQLQHAIHQLQNNHDRIWLQPVHEEQFPPKSYMALKKADDNHSETSHETSTSDSGRGGSEEDIHSHRGHTLSDSEEGRVSRYHMDNRRRIQSDKFVPRRPPPPVPEDTFQRNISFSDDSVNANTTVMSGGRRQLNSPSVSTPSMYKTPKQPQLFFISGKTNGDTFLDSQMTTPGMSYSVADIEEMSEMATCRDDASTTTSGSYTINPDELCNEIDDLFFRDVIV